MQAAQREAAIELSRRVMVCYLELQAKLWLHQGDTARYDVCMGLVYRLRCGSAYDMGHLRTAVEEAATDLEL